MAAGRKCWRTTNRGRTAACDCWEARASDAWLCTSARMPQGKDLDPTCFDVHLVAEVIAGPAQKQAANTLFRRVASTRADPGLNQEKLEGATEIICEGQRSGRTIGPPPLCRTPNLCGSTRRGLDEKPCRQGYWRSSRRSASASTKWP